MSLQVPLQLRRSGPQGPESPQEHFTKNVSLAGVYFETEHPGSLKENDLVFASVTVPETQRRQFPFTRVAGRTRVVRVSELPASSEGRKRIGVALEFGEHTTALTATPSRG
ncbi:MAG: hypothetical protein COV75_04345 [Candidatus Omnitrophica bacterium CG11_big_fil_rev_8_21_14_0_20_63_9]|nr:MAG: hypothetical protein COV75_04345 [Candidatus Omnitrophica bacterium CG11_big_fil_rev_8_21_14_0_20_63_9]